MKPIIFKITLFLVFIITSAYSYAQSYREETERNRMGLNKNVKSCRITSYKPIDRFGEIEKGNIRSCDLFIFNEQGRIVEKKQYDNEGFLWQQSNSTYDEKGNLVAKIISEFIVGAVDKYQYTHTEKMLGDPICQVTENFYSSDKVSQIKVSEYDIKNGEKSRETNYDPEKKISDKQDPTDPGFKSSVVFFTYDETGRLTVETKYNIGGDNAGKFETRYKYDNLGNQLEFERFKYIGGTGENNAVLTVSGKYEYDIKGNRVKALIKVDGKLTSIQENEIKYFDDNSNFSKLETQSAQSTQSSVTKTESNSNSSSKTNKEETNVGLEILKGVADGLQKTSSTPVPNYNSTNSTTSTSGTGNVEFHRDKIYSLKCSYFKVTFYDNTKGHALWLVSWRDVPVGDYSWTAQEYEGDNIMVPCGRTWSGKLKVTANQTTNQYLNDGNATLKYGTGSESSSNNSNGSNSSNQSTSSSNNTSSNNNSYNSNSSNINAGNSNVIVNSGPTIQTQCMLIYDQAWGKNCNSKTSYYFKIKNNCLESIDMKYCVQEANSTWKCGMSSNTAPGAETSFFNCNSTGKVMYWGRKAGDYKIKFPTHDENGNKY